MVSILKNVLHLTLKVKLEAPLEAQPPVKKNHLAATLITLFSCLLTRIYDFMFPAF